MKYKKLISSLLLILAALIWGVAFVAQSVGMKYIGPYTFSFIRCMIGAVVLLPVIYFMRDKNSSTKSTGTKNNRTLIIGGILCGICLCVATNLQQFGLLYSSSGKAGFITTCYIVMVPIIGIFFKKKTHLNIWIGVLIALIGMYFLCILADDGSVNTIREIIYLNIAGIRINIGELYLVLCAIAFSFHIITIDHFSPLTDGIKLSCIQFFVSGLLSGVAMLIYEKASMTAVIDALIPILYTGILSSGVAYTLQIIGQKNLNPTVASLLMSLESVISVLAGWIILGQSLSAYEIIGCILIFCAVVLAQLPVKKK